MIRAILFDMDGVLLDTEALGLQAMSSIAAELGYTANRDFYLNTLGVPNSECKQIYLDALGQDFPYETAMERFRAYFSDYSRAQPMPRKEGLMGCLTGLKARGLKIVLATSTVRSLVTEYASAMPEVAAMFDGAVCGGEVPFGKPAPDIYLAAARAVSCEPSECLGVEDSLSGLKAIRASGARAVMIPDLMPFDDQFRPYVDDLLHSLTELCPLVDRLNAGHPVRA